MFRSAVLTVTLLCVPALASAQQPCTTDARHVVNELYRHMLERPAGDASAGWVRQLESGGMTVRDLVREIATSPEYVKRFFHTEAGEEAPYIRSVGRFYRHLLGRQPDAAGARGFAQLAERQGPAAVVSGILKSQEYEQQFGSWGVPGSGGVRFCATAGTASRNRSAAVAPTAGRLVVVDANQPWTDTGMMVRQGQTIVFDVEGDIRLSQDPNDAARSPGALSGRRAPNAPLPDAPAGALIGRIAGSEPFGIGNQRAIEAPATGRLHLGINDDHFEDNDGAFRVTIDVR